MRKKIFIVTTVPETFANILKEQPRFLSKYFDVQMVTSCDDNLSSVNEGVKVHCVPMVRGINILRDLISVLKMITLFLKERPLLVHSYTPKAGMVTMLAAFICRVPVRIHTFTGLIFPTQSGFKKKLLINIDRLTCACATTVVPEGKGVENDLVNYRVTLKPMNVIGHGNIAGVNIDFFKSGLEFVRSKVDALRIELGFSNDSFVFCYVGRLNRDKGLKELAEAFTKCPAHVHLLIVGGHDVQAPVDARTLDVLQQHKRIHLLGFQDDIRIALEASDALVLPSYREGFPNVVLQAGAMSKPCVVTDISGCNEIIEQGVNGWLAKPKDTQSLLRAMFEAIDETPEKLSRMGAFARLRVTERFEQTAHWERMKAFYSQELKLD